jgi:hypothetical protein
MPRHARRPHYSPIEQAKLVEAIKDIRQQLGACKGGQRPFDEIYHQCDRASHELAALAIMLTDDPEMFGYQLPPSVGSRRRDVEER